MTGLSVKCRVLKSVPPQTLALTDFKDCMASTIACMCVFVFLQAGQW